MAKDIETDNRATADGSFDEAFMNAPEVKDVKGQYEKPQGVLYRQPNFI